MNKIRFLRGDEEGWLERLGGPDARLEGPVDNSGEAPF